MIAKQEELNQIERKKVWSLVAPRENHSNIGIKWKLNEDGEIVMKNKKLVVQGCCQKKKNDFDETFTLVTRLESL